MSKICPVCHKHFKPKTRNIKKYMKKYRIAHKKEINAKKRVWYKENMKSYKKLKPLHLEENAFSPCKVF